MVNWGLYMLMYTHIYIYIYTHIVWHADLLLGNDREKRKYTIAIVLIT
jgi:hypothetical protein